MALSQGIVQQSVEHPRLIHQEGAGYIPPCRSATAPGPESANGETTVVEPEAGGQLLGYLHHTPYAVADLGKDCLDSGKAC